MLKYLLTIVIPCKNEGIIIKNALSFLNKQKAINGIRVIICDSSTDDTRKYIESEMGKNLKIEILSGGLPSIARNKGLSKVTTRFVLFLDADINIEDKNLLYNILKKTSILKLELTTVRVRTKDYYSIIFKIFDMIRSIFLKKPFALGGFMLFKTSVVKKLGGFNVEDKIAEDFTLSSKINYNKFKIFDDIVYTSSRRFRKKGVLYMIKIMILSYLNKNNPEFFKQDFNYFDEKNIK